jgi:hypothetical protein
MLSSEPGKRANLILVAWDNEPATRANIEQLAALVHAVDPHIHAIAVTHHKLPQLALWKCWFEPTLSLSLYRVPKQKLLPGNFVTGHLLSKHLDYERLGAAGIPVPKWTVLAPGTQIDADEWGPYVVQKPSNGARGAYVQIRKSSRVRYIAPDQYPPDHMGRDGPMVVQEFIYTGEWPTCYRVLTLFGEALLCYRFTSTGHGKPLSGRWGFSDFGGTSIVANTRDMRLELTNDSDIIAFAEGAHRAAYPECPTLAFDIIRDVETGKLYALESHPEGSWSFSTDLYANMKADRGIDLAKQFNAFEKAASILARKTHELARISSPFGSVR